MKTSIFMKTGLTLLCVISLVSCKKQSGQMPAGEYKAITIAPSTSVLEKEYTATLKGAQNVEVRPQVSGTITQICVKEGAKVNKGQTLFVIDQVPYKAALQTAIASVNSAKASVANSRLTLKSKQQLRNQNVVSDFDVQQAQNNLDEAVASLQNAQASVLSARNNLSYTVVKSPADGVIGMIPYRVGALVNSSITDPLATVSDNADVYAYFSITEGEMQQLMKEYGTTDNAIKNMPKVKLRMSDGADYDISGTIDAMSGNVDATTGSVTLRATFQNPKALLRNGGSGTIVMDYHYENAIVIPQEATYELQDKKFCYRIIKGKAKSTDIEVLNMDNGKQWVVLSGLKTGDVIVAEGAGLIHDGQAIKTKK